MKAFPKLHLIITGCVAAALLAGCGAGQTTHLQAATDAIADLQYDVALTDLETALAEGEHERTALRLKGIACLKSARYTEAAEAFRSALSLSDGIPSAADYDMNLYLAAAYEGMGDDASAIAVYDHILALRPSDIDTLYARGAASLRAGDLTGATASFDTAIAASPRDFDLRIRVARAYEEAGYPDTGRAILNDALRTYDAAMTNYEKGRFAFYMGNNGEAQSYLERALSSARGEERAQIVLLLGLTGETQGDLNYAMSVYNDFLAADKSHAEIYNRRGLCRIAQGDYTGAIADFEAGIALHDDAVHQALLRNEITAYEYAGNFASAARLMREYVSRYPDDADAQREWQFLSTR